MAELAARAGRAVHRAPVHDEDAADADLDGQVQDDPRPGARAAPGLGQPGERGVVADEQGTPASSSGSKATSRHPMPDAWTTVVPLTVPATHADTARSRRPKRACKADTWSPSVPRTVREPAWRPAFSVMTRPPSSTQATRQRSWLMSATHTSGPSGWAVSAGRAAASTGSGGRARRPAGTP